jgi:uncharacterized protein YecE (DUF72 family)
LHGRGGWRYQYEDGELEELALTLPKRTGGYVFFNSYKMTEDALRFCKLLALTQDAEGATVRRSFTGITISFR